jgi:uncharacterized protein YjbJ (UPF0337 family)
MKLSTRYQVKGLFRVVKGTAEEFAGKISSNKMLGVKGKFERLTGTVQRKIGKIQGLCGL